MKTVFSILALSFLVSCNFNYRSVSGSGNIIKEDRQVSGFTGIDAAGPMDVEVKMGTEFHVTVETDDNLQRYVIIRREGNSLVVKLSENIRVRDSKTMKVYVEMPMLKSVDVAGSGNVTCEGIIENNDKIDVDVAGSGNVTMEVRTPAVSASTAGSGKTILKGETKKLDVDIAGSGDIDASELKSEEGNVSIAGSGNVKLFSSLKLDVSIVGSGDVLYYGSPSISQSVIGSGNIKKGQ